jgi:hypothetical protein
MTDRAFLPMPLAAAAAVLALGAACGAPGTPVPSAEGASSPQALVGDAACRADEQCATVGIGAKACGGPSSYLAYSTLRTDVQRLRAAAELEAQAQRKQMQARGEMSNCAVVPDPGAYCDRTQSGGNALGVCRLRGGGPAGSPAIR